MSPEALASQRVYVELRDLLLSGRFPPGASLVGHSLAVEFGVSISPMRDVMQRMVGERLLDPQPGGGFQIPRLDRGALYDLHMWHWQVVRLAVKSQLIAASAVDLDERLDTLCDSDDMAIADVTARLFLHLAENSANREYPSAVRVAGDRLHAARLAERPIRHRIRELQTLWSLARSCQNSELQAAIWRYHRRRLKRLVP